MVAAAEATTELRQYPFYFPMCFLSIAHNAQCTTSPIVYLFSSNFFRPDISPLWKLSRVQFYELIISNGDNNNNAWHWTHRMSPLAISSHSNFIGNNIFDSAIIVIITIDSCNRANPFVLHIFAVHVGSLLMQFTKWKWLFDLSIRCTVIEYKREIDGRFSAQFWIPNSNAGTILPSKSTHNQSLMSFFSFYFRVSGVDEKLHGKLIFFLSLLKR